MAKTKTAQTQGIPEAQGTAVAAAMLAGVIYQARLLNRQAKLNIPEREIIADVIGLWHTVMDALSRGA